jgi:hypothetical protein
MGMLDSFHDEDAECPKCHAKISAWQTKDLESLGEHWNKGDFVQYHKWETVPKSERKRKYGKSPVPLFQSGKEYLSDAPLLFNGKVPVHMSCDKCNAWLEGYAKILDGRFAGIVEAEADVGPKPWALIKREITAATLRADYEKRLSELQESCSHKKTMWMDIEWAPAHYFGRALVCLRCEKRLKIKQGWESIRALSPSRRVRPAGKLDKKTVKSLKTGDEELRKRQYKVASSREDIERILSS